MCLGIPGKVIDIWEEAGTRMSTVEFGGTTKTVCLAYLPDMAVGEYTIVHAGFAITRLDEASAHETLRCSPSWASSTRNSPVSSRSARRDPA